MKRSAAVILIMALPLLTGCFGTDNYFKGVRNDVIKTCKEDFSREIEFSIGSAGLSFAGLFVTKEHDPVAAEILEDLSDVQIGVYHREHSTRTYSNSQILRRIDKRMKKAGWNYIVRNCSKDEITAVYVNKHVERGLNHMFVVSLDNEELTIVQLEGNLNRVVEIAVRERGLEYNN